MAEKEQTPIPAGPWTEAKLGTELYEKLAREYGVLEPTPTFRPALGLMELYKAQQADASAKAKKEK